MTIEDPRDDAFHLAGDRLGKFVILSELGRGSMGVVYEAFQEDLKRKVALKILPANISLDKKQVKRFHREAESVARLRHDNVIQIYEVGAIDNTHYFAMELVEGQAYGYLKGRDAETIREAARIASHAARGLAHGHERGVVHRDIKPSNLLVDADGRVVVTDFGLARLTESASLTSTDAIVGTPKYMSPEQILPGTYPLDGRTDVYSLGAALYEVIAGRPPLEEPSVQAFLRAILEKRPPSPRKFNRQVPHDLATIVMRCLEKDPADRYESASALADDLDRFLAGERIVMRPRGKLARAYETVRRHKVIAALALAAAVAVFLVLVLAGGLSKAEEDKWLLSRINLIEGLADVDMAFQEAEKLARRRPGSPRIAELFASLHRHRAEAELRKPVVDFDRVARSFEEAGEAGGFWHLMALVRVGRLDAARALAEALPEDNPLRRLVLGLVAFERGLFENAVETLTGGPPEDAPLALKSIHQLFLSLAYIEVGRTRPADEALDYFRNARELLDEPTRVRETLQQAWLRTLILKAGLDVRQLMGDTLDPRDLFPDLALVQRTFGGIAQLMKNLSGPETEAAQEYLDRVVAVAGTEQKTSSLLEQEATGRITDAGTDARKLVLGQLLLGVARFKNGDAQGALDAFRAADENGVAELEPYVYWGQSLVLRAQDKVGEAVPYAVLALEGAEEAFPDLEPLTQYATLLGEEASRRGLRDGVAMTREILEMRLGGEQPPDWATALLERIRRAVAAAPPR